MRINYTPISSEEALKDLAWKTNMALACLMAEPDQEAIRSKIQEVRRYREVLGVERYSRMQSRRQAA